MLGAYPRTGVNDSADSFGKLVERQDPSIRKALEVEFKRSYGTDIPSAIELRLDDIGNDGDFRVSTNLASRAGVDEEDTHKIIEHPSTPVPRRSPLLDPTPVGTNWPNEPRCDDPGWCVSWTAAAARRLLEAWTRPSASNTKPHKPHKPTHPGDGRGGVKMAPVRAAAGLGRCRCLGCRSYCRAGARVGD